MVITAFNDGTIFLWETDSFAVVWRITLDRFAADVTESLELYLRLMLIPRTNYVATSKDGEYMLYGGLSSSVYVWNLVEKRLVHEILIPSFKDRIISQMEFIGNSYVECTKIVAVLSSGGEILFFNAMEAKMVGRLKGKHQYFFSHRNPISVDKVLMETYKIHDRTPDNISPSSFLKPFEPILLGQYPIFNKFPEFIVNYQSKMKERIRQDEEDYIRKRKLTAEVNMLSEELRKDKADWERADWKVNEMVEKWWDSMMNMEESHTERKARLDAMEKEQRARALRRIAEARRSFVDHQYSTTKLRANALARTVGVNARDVETKADEELLDAKFREVESEWLARREQMLSARQELARLDRA
ncbi:TBC1 domain member 31, partial [Phlyctochytrium bullatum]